MELWRLWVLRGPNPWAACPVIEAGLDLSAWSGQPRQQSADAVRRLRTWIPSLDAELESSEVALCLRASFSA